MYRKRNYKINKKNAGHSTNIISEAARNWHGNRETGIDSFCKMTSGKPKE
jgi:hypothetical protein